MVELHRSERVGFIRSEVSAFVYSNDNDNLIFMIFPFFFFFGFGVLLHKGGAFILLRNSSLQIWSKNEG